MGKTSLMTQMEQARDRHDRHAKKADESWEALTGLRKRFWDIAGLPPVQWPLRWGLSLPARLLILGVAALLVIGLAITTLEFVFMLFVFAVVWGIFQYVTLEWRYWDDKQRRHMRFMKTMDKMGQ